MSNSTNFPFILHILPISCTFLTKISHPIYESLRSLAILSERFSDKTFNVPIVTNNFVQMPSLILPNTSLTRCHVEEPESNKKPVFVKCILAKTENNPFLKLNFLNNLAPFAVFLASKMPLSASLPCETAQG